MIKESHFLRSVKNLYGAEHSIIKKQQQSVVKYKIVSISSQTKLLLITHALKRNKQSFFNFLPLFLHLSRPLVDEICLTDYSFLQKITEMWRAKISAQNCKYLAGSNKLRIFLKRQVGKIFKLINRFTNKPRKKQVLLKRENAKISIVFFGDFSQSKHDLSS